MKILCTLFYKFEYIFELLCLYWAVECRGFAIVRVVSGVTPSFENDPLILVYCGTARWYRLESKLGHTWSEENGEHPGGVDFRKWMHAGNCIGLEL